MLVVSANCHATAYIHMTKYPPLYSYTLCNSTHVYFCAHASDMLTCCRHVSALVSLIQWGARTPMQLIVTAPMHHAQMRLIMTTSSSTSLAAPCLFLAPALTAPNSQLLAGLLLQPDPPAASLHGKTCIEKYAIGSWRDEACTRRHAAAKCMSLPDESNASTARNNTVI